MGEAVSALKRESTQMKAEVKLDRNKVTECLQDCEEGGAWKEQCQRRKLTLLNRAAEQKASPAVQHLSPPHRLIRSVSKLIPFFFF